MARGDLQIGDVWTRPDARGKGYATAAMEKICQLCAGKGLTLWYIVEETNAASIRVVEKVGFDLMGFGKKHSRFFLPIFGFYAIEKN